MVWHLALVPAEAGFKGKASLVYIVSSRPGETFSQITKRREREKGWRWEGGKEEGRQRGGDFSQFREFVIANVTNMYTDL